MKSRSLMLWNMLFLVWGLLVGLLVAFPAELGLAADSDSLPAEQQTDETIGHMPPEPEELVIESDIMLMPPSESTADDDTIANEVEPEVHVSGSRISSASLTFLSDMQSSGGSYSAKTTRPSKRQRAWSYGPDTACDSEDGFETDSVANTALALFAFTNAGYDHTMGEFKGQCRSAIQYLRKNQATDGTFSKIVRHHCMATMAMVDAYGLSGASVLRPIAERAIAALVKAQRYDGGFGDGNSSNVIDTAWAVLALKHAKMVGLEIDMQVISKAFQYIETLRSDTHVWYSNYDGTQPQAGNYTVTDFPICQAAWLFCGLFSHELTLQDDSVKEMSKLLVQPVNLPKWKANNIDTQYYWFASLALFQVGGDYWKKWQASLSNQLLHNQRGYSKSDVELEMSSAKQLLEHGSWDPAGTNGPRYGRVYTTAMCAMSLEIINRYHYARVVEPDPTEDEQIVEDPWPDDPTDGPCEDLLPKSKPR